MCGRYILTTDGKTLADTFAATLRVALEPRYNIAPTQPVPIVRADRDGGGRHIDLVRWGLIPHWADDPSIGNRMINARAETVASKPAFRSAVRYRRCLVPTDGFYEWTKRPDGRKQPHLVRLADESPFGMAGLWEHWQDANGNEIESCTILTTAANAMMRKLHDRQPLILEPEDYDRWLDPSVQDPDAIADLLEPFPAERMMYHPVSPVVNNPKHDDPRCVEPIERDT